MIGKIARTYLYAKAPKTTFAVLHPKRAVRLRKMKWDMRHAYAPRIAAIGAAALALPLGFAIGRRTSNGTHE